MLNDLSREALERELNRFVQQGREVWLERNGVQNRKARSYFILWMGIRCDMKAVVHVALGKPKANIGNSIQVAEVLVKLRFKWNSNDRRMLEPDDHDDSSSNG